jgi:enoyl-CoA hydratase
MNAFFLLDVHEHVAHLRLNQPASANTMAPAFFPELRDAVRGLHEGATARVLVISSTGPHFSAGLSLDAYGSSEAPPAAQRADRRDPRESAAREAIGAIMQMLDERSAGAPLGLQGALQRLTACFNALDDAPFPVICAVQGGCIGAALDLACACDIRVCSADAFFTPDESDLGMTADLGVLQRLARVMPPGAARELAYTGERLPAARALELGLVNAVLPDAAALLAHALTLAGRIAAKSPQAMAGAKLAFRRARDGEVAPLAPITKA